MSASLASSLSPLLERGLAGLGLTLPPEAVQRLVEYVALIDRWNRVYNLTAVREPAQMVVQHVLDSLAVVPPLRRHLAAAQADSGPAGTATGVPPRILDVGSGAGLPGVVWAIAESIWALTCVDAVAKKAGFIRQVAVELGLPTLRALHVRVEDLSATPAYDVITSRAFASLSDFVTLTRDLVSPAGCWLAMKGRRPDDEIAALPPDVRVFHVERLTVPGLDAERCLIWLKKAPT
jgi:16S rRNA (guanine527-N7)-methyltransferase